MCSQKIHFWFCSFFPPHLLKLVSQSGISSESLGIVHPASHQTCTGGRYNEFSELPVLFPGASFGGPPKTHTE